jgi:hypothetical protein
MRDQVGAETGAEPEALCGDRCRLLRNGTVILIRTLGLAFSFTAIETDVDLAREPLAIPKTLQDGIEPGARAQFAVAGYEESAVQPVDSLFDAVKDGVSAHHEAAPNRLRRDKAPARSTVLLSTLKERQN